METLSERVENLEQRLSAVERRLGAEAPPLLPGRVYRPERTPAPAVVPPPRAEPLPPRRRRPPAPPPPRRSLEMGMGRWALSRLGGIALVLAAGFLFHYVATRGLLGPAARIILGFLTGGALLAGGEWQHKKVKQFAAALAGSGLGILFLSAYAGHALYDFYSNWTAVLLAVGIMGAGVVQSLRHDVEAVAGIAAIGGFLAPVFVDNMDPYALLTYVTVLNAGLCALRARTGWLSAEIIAWLATPFVAALPIASLPLGEGLAFLMANIALFGVRPRLRDAPSHVAMSLVLSAVTAATSFVLFEIHRTPGWHWFAGGMAVVTGVAAVVNARRAPRVAVSDMIAAVGFVILGVQAGFDGVTVVVTYASLAVALLLVPWPHLRREARLLGAVVAVFSVLQLVQAEALGVDRAWLGFLAVGAALGSIDDRRLRYAGVAVAAWGIGLEVAAATGGPRWFTLLLLAEQTGDVPTARLLACGTVAALVGLYAAYRKDRGPMLTAGALFVALLAADGVYALDGRGHIPLGLLAAAALFAWRPWTRSIWAVAVALALAVAADLIPPVDYLPFLNRRAIAIGSVLGIGWLLLRGRPEGRATAIMAALLAVAEIASVADRTGGANPWHHLVLDLRTHGGLTPFLNARFVFLAGAGAVAFLVGRWRSRVAVLGHVYVVAALGAEVVAAVAGGRYAADPWAIFLRAGSNMMPHLALTGVILGYGASCVAGGIVKRAPLLRQVGLGALIVGGIKVVVIDLTALDSLYRVGSLVVVGVTFLAGNYAYSRYLRAETEPNPLSEKE